MGTKTYNVNLKALKTIPDMNCKLNALNNGEVIAYKKRKNIEADLDSLFLTNNNHILQNIYGDEMTMNPSFTEVPNKLRIAEGTTDLRGLFSWCEYLTKIDLSNIDMSKIKDISGMFSYMTSMRQFDLRGVDVSNIIKMDDLFGNCESAEVIDITGWDTSKCKNFNFMFHACNNLREVKGVIDASSVEYHRSSDTIDLTGWGGKLPKLEKPIKIKNVPRGIYVYGLHGRDDCHGQIEVLSYR